MRGATAHDWPVEILTGGALSSRWAARRLPPAYPKRQRCRGISNNIKTIDGLILWLLSSRHSLSFDLGSAWPVWHAVQNRCGADATRIEIFRQD